MTNGRHRCPRPSVQCRCIALLLCTTFSGTLAGRLPPAAAPTAAPGPLPSPADQALSKAADQRADLLFIQQAKQAILKIDPSNSTRGSLLLRGVPSSVIWFTDRPLRNAGMLDTSFFSGPDFADDNGTWLSSPNAALYGSNPGPSAANDTVIVLTLGPPTYDGLNATVKYEVTIVPVQKDAVSRKQRAARVPVYQSFLAKEPSGPALLTEPSGNVVLDNVALFIDDWGVNWGGGWGGWGRGGGGGGGWGGVDGRGWHHWDHDWEGGRGFCPYGFSWGYYSVGWYGEVWWNGGWGCWHPARRVFY